MAIPRRNGQLSSCEPCRKAKLRCDHQSPVCGRCLRTDRTELCFYHPAPQTQSRASPIRVPSRRSRKQRPNNQVTFRVDKRISTAAAQGPLPALPSGLSPVIEDAKTPCDQHLPRCAGKKRRNLRPGLFGLVSPQDIFSDYEDSLQGDDLECDPEAAASTTTAHPTDSDSDHIQRGARILSHLQKIRWFRAIIELKNKTSPGWALGPALTRVLCDSMERMYDSAVGGSPDTHASLLHLSLQICTNTSEDIRTHAAMSANEYIESITARWETVGLFFALLGTALFNTPDSDPVFTNQNPSNLSKTQLRNISTTVGELCCQFCNSAGTSSDPFCWLVIQQVVLLTSMFGDSDYRVWQKLGDLSTIVYAFGLHRSDRDVKPSLPFFLVEIRKRVLVCAYAMDKELATSLGRPPRICSRYCHLPLPLDISYEEMVFPGTTEETALLKLDADGWNTEGRFTVGVKLRVVLMTSLLRESTLELSLSPGIRNLTAKVEDLIQECRKMQQGLPTFMRWSAEEAATGAYHSTQDEGRAFAHIEFTYQEFLLHRILLKRLGVTSLGLIESAVVILTTLLDIIAMQARSGKSAINMSWDLCYMGLPAAGVLTSQLLAGRNSQIPPSSPPPLPANFRSRAVQKLSVFVSHLTSLVRNDDGNYEVAQKGAKFIRWALDQVLSPPQVPHPAVWNEDPDLPQGWLLDCDLTEDFDFLAWCDTVNWSQDSF
ncbi:hypothetical protein ASPACDRAFT_24719 [Aspergillus aculeatus ATCC 16872]|uniref:Zn(2)-C6 fungal-type domain-containing protein n=1 Tax=Aspergillus aculeatus (strain ATCC 16872 / CBS 172.66 / WB 5094) TaxID=690307 RepID=A0A1L9X133_ASPA1|nr:uncharacterized protein ASPACDRAFT_24719 [Aspergillus aculeatus ATCC 16872]OJK01999.1 hypothetical protein ASPACDRAFT_24719 [Aspergillus aculeatus ATCC 16872]